MGSQEINDLMNALNNDKNENIINLSSSKIKTEKNDILQQLQLSGAILKTFHKKLKLYRYCENIYDIQYGCFIRWISLKNPDNIKITNGGIVCDIKIHADQPHILCKNNMNRFFQVKFDECLIFQKLTQQEQILLTVLDYLEK
jgi:hypothetical protein